MAGQNDAKRSRRGLLFIPNDLFLCHKNTLIFKNRQYRVRHHEIIGQKSRPRVDVRIDEILMLALVKTENFRFRLLVFGSGQRFFIGVLRLMTRCRDSGENSG